MAETPSKMVALGTIAPDFRLYDVLSQQDISLNDVKSDIATVIMFICNHCPFVKHINYQLVDLANDYIYQGISFIAISSNDAIFYPEDGPDRMRRVGGNEHYPFPYLYDETQEVAKAYDAACTPDFFIYDKDMKLVYRGQFDDSRPGYNKPITGNDIRNALNAILSGHPVSEKQKPSIGCNIKWF